MLLRLHEQSLAVTIQAGSWADSSEPGKDRSKVTSHLQLRSSHRWRRANQMSQTRLESWSGLHHVYGGKRASGMEAKTEDRPNL